VSAADPALAATYGSIPDGTMPPGIPGTPGTIVVDPGNRFLYLVMENGVALRYGVGVGRAGFAWVTAGGCVDWQFRPRTAIGGSMTTTRSGKLDLR
jgi:lipoprotein-anchoring transpeptidase ErfK/SrfK